MATSDKAKLKLATAAKTKICTPVGCKRTLTRVASRGSAKPGTSVGNSSAKDKPNKAALVVHFTEDNDEVTFQVEAPDGFPSDGEIASSSDSDEELANMTMDDSQDAKMLDDERGGRDARS